ncbi:SHOCT domain-containing protein [Amycolatopsis sp. NPDC059657]|uniref:SHOCT domain-containing protein n=1 Tax=Amycolatopsis sp. NPDC059657 TaxID=3346899 RepID=UPI00366F5C59
MHYYWDNSWPMSVLMLILMVAFVGALIAAVVVLLRRTGPRPGDSAARILDERFARGELDEEEYRKRKAALRGDA